MFVITDTIGHRHSPSTTSVIASITSVVNARFQTERRPTPGANPRDHKIGVGMVYTWACRDPAVNLRLPRNGAPPAIWHARCIVAGTPAVLTLPQGGPQPPRTPTRPTPPGPRPPPPPHQPPPPGPVPAPPP